MLALRHKSSDFSRQRGAGSGVFRHVELLNQMTTLLYTTHTHTHTAGVPNTIPIDRSLDSLQPPPIISQLGIESGVPLQYNPGEDLVR